MVTMKVTSDVDRVLGDIESGMSGAVARSVLKAATFAGGAIAQTVNIMFDGGTGNLARSFLPARFVRIASGEIAAGALSDLPYARIQDEGGTIRPRGRYLAVPLTPEAKLRWPRDWAARELFVFKSRNKRNLLLAQRMGGGRLRFHYALKKSVQIPATDYIERAEAVTKAEVEEITNAELRMNINSAGGTPRG